MLPAIKMYEGFQADSLADQGGAKRRNLVCASPVHYYFTRAFWAIAVAAYFFQFPFGQLSSLIVPAMGLFLIVKIATCRDARIDRSWRIAFCCYVAYLAIMVTVSVLRDENLTNVCRFALILGCLPLFAVIDDGDAQFNASVFTYAAVAKGVMLAGIAVYLVAMGTHAGIRDWALSNSLGDIYINPFTHLPKVQVRGNGILPLAFMLACEQRRRLPVKALLLVGVLAAGNAAFIGGVALYALYRVAKVALNPEAERAMRVAAILAVFLGVAVACLYGAYQLQIKADFSNANRFEQAEVLLSGNVLLGEGVGFGVYYEGAMRTYVGDTYFELQTLYVLRQIGVIGLALFYYLMLSRMKRAGSVPLALFAVYLLYTFWNPYCFDTTEMMAVYLLANALEKHCIRKRRVGERTHRV